MHPATFALAFVCYATLVFTLKRVTYPKIAEPPPPFPLGWVKGHEYALAVSQDFWWAKRFKARIKQFEPDQFRRSSLKRYVQDNNTVNFWTSTALATSLFLVHVTAPNPLLYQVLLAAAVIRLVSRSFEIAYAFGLDVLQKSENTTGLDKFERIKLALVSYVEIFVYSAAAYLALPTTKSPLEAITLSLNVGTLTNVGFAFPDRASLLCHNIVFIQVFTTLSLVVLSLASYLSREE
jgi:hypothetical protein